MIYSMGKLRYHQYDVLAALVSRMLDAGQLAHYSTIHITNCFYGMGLLAYQHHQVTRAVGSGPVRYVVPARHA